ncbi:unnamed protein product [Paramecium sonneborni]|uniref:Uncharacterized protein n=1 Tax=Paramecium sonneborni TaxID=65129 RepID=A0A8S1MY79_9CILI|nr:unnamed protein product [Paramecium sonneborni]
MKTLNLHILKKDHFCSIDNKLDFLANKFQKQPKNQVDHLKVNISKRYQLNEETVYQLIISLKLIRINYKKNQIPIQINYLKN